MSELSKWGDELKSMSKRNLLRCMNDNSERREEKEKKMNEKQVQTRNVTEPKSMKRVTYVVKE